MSQITKDWMREDIRTSLSYRRGVKQFVESAKKNCGGETLFSCPCNRCQNRKGKYDLETISLHLFEFGIDQSYIVWNFHGEKQQSTSQRIKTIDEFNHPRIEEMVDDGYGVHQREVNPPDILQNEEGEGKSYDVHVGPETRADKKYKDLRAKAKQPLYPSCPKHQTTLSTIVGLQNLKSQFGWSRNSMTELLKFFKEHLPEGNTLPDECPKMKRMIKELGMDYISIHACTNDCILYWKENKDKVECPICKAPRYKVTITARKKYAKREPLKVLRHFPLIPRLKRLYSIPWIENEMTWHNRAKTSIDVMRHPVDSIAWLSADRKWPEFADESRNIRLGIATDGFSPHGTMSSSYSCWPVILVPYNLPPSMCMKREFSMLSLLIPGPKAPGKDIDVFLQPLIEELKELWSNGVPSFDSYKNEDFTLKAMLLWAIHDFPAYGVLSGCKVHGYKACPVCAEETDSISLEKSRKICYLGHRKFLPTNHKFREDKHNFNKKVEYQRAPRRLSGSEVEQKVAGIKFKPGKAKLSISSKKRKYKDVYYNDDTDAEEVELNSDKKKDAEDELNKAWSRRSILFDLPYWKEHKVRHNLDVMHIEKNVTEHLISTILEQKDKTKDNLNARKDMETMGIKRSLWLVEDSSTGKTVKPKGAFSLDKKEKVLFCQSLKDLKVPTGFSSNLGNNVSIKPPELKGCKSHDYHVIMQHLLPVLIQHAYQKHKDLGRAICRISIFFNLLCSKVVKRDDIILARDTLIEALCVLEKYFPPSFFVISIHLMVHLAEEVLICGPVRYRWMYPFERLMKKYKDSVHNKRRKEGCIAEEYIIDEAVMYCMEYMPNEDTGSHKHTREGFLDEDDEYADEFPLDKGKTITLSKEQFIQARRWVLKSYEGVDEWKEKYALFIQHSHKNKRVGSTTVDIDDNFITWLVEELLKVNDTKSTLWRLANGPLLKAQTYSKYRVNGFMFSPRYHEANLLTQDSGVCMRAFTKYRSSTKDKNIVEDFTTYYGIIREIIELDYIDFKQTVFYCDWVRVEDKTNACKVDSSSKYVIVNLEKLKSREGVEDEPFILSSEASQVFYSKDLVKEGWSTVLHTPRRLTTKVDDKEIPNVYQSTLEDNPYLKEFFKSL